MDAFYNGIRTVELPLAVNDYLTVIGGRKPGAKAFAISLHSMPPDPKYLVEYEIDGSDDIVPMSLLMRHRGKRPAGVHPSSP